MSTDERAIALPLCSVDCLLDGFMRFVREDVQVNVKTAKQQCLSRVRVNHPCNYVYVWIYYSDDQQAFTSHEVVKLAQYESFERNFKHEGRNIPLGSELSDTRWSAVVRKVILGKDEPFDFLLQTGVLGIKHTQSAIIAAQCNDVMSP